MPIITLFLCQIWLPVRRVHRGVLRLRGIGPLEKTVDCHLSCVPQHQLDTEGGPGEHATVFRG